MKILTTKATQSLFAAVLLCLLAFGGAAVLALRLAAEKAAVCILLAALGAFGAILIALYSYFRRQDRLLEAAGEQITHYLSGDRNARIDCDDEGALCKLFHQVNALAAILNAHAENETRAKEFLKNALSDISHQLKTPLAALNLYNGILQEEAKNLPEIQEFTALTEGELDRMETLVQNLLKITKLDAGTIQFEKREESLPEMMEEIKSRFQFRADREGKEIRLKGDAAVLWCDRQWLVQAMENIVKNALDHTEAGGQIHVAWKRLPSIVQITVRDNGCGIHPEDIHHIFKRFYRSRFSKDTQGIGLGLPLAKAIIEAHNGSIQADSQVGAGTTFTVNFLIPTKL